MSLAEQPLNICENFLSVAEKFDKDRGALDDTNTFFSCNGYGVRKSHPATSIIYLPILSTRPEMGQVSRQTRLSSTCFIFIIFARYIDIETGRRSDTAHYYIYNQDHNKNLKILVRHRVVRVIFEYVFVSSLVHSRIMILILAGVPVQSELNMFTIQLEEQRVLQRHS